MACSQLWKNPTPPPSQSLPLLLPGEVCSLGGREEAGFPATSCSQPLLLFQTQLCYWKGVL